ncbi:MAG: hypothetical protein AB8B67_02085 [Rickettsiaceae bacterium]
MKTPLSNEIRQGYNIQYHVLGTGDYKGNPLKDIISAQYNPIANTLYDGQKDHQYLVNEKYDAWKKGMDVDNLEKCFLFTLPVEVENALVEENQAAEDQAEENQAAEDPILDQGNEHPCKKECNPDGFIKIKSSNLNTKTESLQFEMFAPDNASKESLTAIVKDLVKIYPIVNGFNGLMITQLPSIEYIEQALSDRHVDHLKIQEQVLLQNGFFKLLPTSDIKMENHVVASDLIQALDHSNEFCINRGIREVQIDQNQIDLNPGSRLMEHFLSGLYTYDPELHIQLYCMPCVEGIEDLDMTNLIFDVPLAGE